MRYFKVSGVIATGEGWFKPKTVELWRRAHAEDVPDISVYAGGTLNVQLPEGVTFSPPDDILYRRKSLARWEKLTEEKRSGIEFLRNGNYIHPRLRVVSLNSVPVTGGRLYFPGDGKTIPDNPFLVGRLEILAHVKLRPLLGLSDGMGADVVLEFDSEPAAH